MLRILEGPIQPLTSVAFSPDGNTILTGSHHGQAGIWDIESGKGMVWFRTHSAPRGYPWSNAVSAAFSPDGTKVLIGFRGGPDDLETDPTQLWETGGERLLLEGPTDKVASVAFSPDGNNMLTGLENGSACLWETGSGKLLNVLAGHASTVTSVAFSPDGSKILTGSSDKTAQLWETAIDSTYLFLKKQRPPRK